MFATGVCVLAMYASQVGTALEAPTPPAPSALVAAAPQPAGDVGVSEEARRWLSAEELALLESDRRLLAPGGDDTEDMWSAYAAVGIASVAAIVILLVIF